jgi:hypothetical protein
MNKPPALIELIEELKKEGITSDIEAEPGAYALVKFSDDEVRLNGYEARLLLSNEDTVNELLDALNLDSEEAHIEFHGLEVPDSILEDLMVYFQTVDEV